MKISILKIFLVQLFVVPLIITNAQSLDFLVELEQEDEVYFDYKYEEFNNYAYLDSTIILESFIGVQNLHKDSISYQYPQGSYYFTVEKIGKLIKRTFYDTLSVNYINTKFPIVIHEFVDADTLGAKHRITGWIFLDTLLSSVVDTTDSIPMYPYKHLYRHYYPENDDSLFYDNDTLFIHYRPTTTNYYDSYFSTDYYIRKNHGLIYHSRYYSYSGVGFRESYEFTGAALIDDVKESDSKIIKNFSIQQNFPNPFNPSTSIKYGLPEESNVKIEVFNMLGQSVGVLVNDNKSAGYYETIWNAQNLPSGIYLISFRAEGLGSKKSFTQVKKALLLK